MNVRSRCLILSVLLLAGCSGTAPLQNSLTQPDRQTDDTRPRPYEKSPDDSGMWLLTQIDGPVHAELAAKGLNLRPREIYHPDRPSLNQAIVRINIGQNGGGTGSFVSKNGLILTNHHVAYDAIAAASSSSDNYLDRGFYAESQDREIRARNYTLYIQVEQTEVTGRIQSELPENLTGDERSRAVQQLRNGLIRQRSQDDPDLVVEIDDYWAGNRQFLSVYKVIRDVRLVYAPPESIGKYGGDIDNWQWPRHTGDFAFLRAYVAPDGRSRPYDKDNVPFRPARHLTINANGMKPDQFAMTLGFPGSTYRYESSYAFDFYHNVKNPVQVESFRAILDAMEYAAKQDSDIAVGNASERASVANTLKYLQGVQTGFDRYGIIRKKRTMESVFTDWYSSDSLRKARYGRVLDQLNQSFDIAAQTGDLLYATYYPLANNLLIQIGSLYNPYFKYLQHPDSLSFSRARKDTLLAQHRRILQSANLTAQNRMLGRMIYNLASFPPRKRMLLWIDLFDEKTGDELREAVDGYIRRLNEESIVFRPEQAADLLTREPTEAADIEPDPMVKLYRELYDTFVFSRKNYTQHFTYLNPARKRYVEGMLEFRQDSTEYPDANFTLRLSGGRVMGYSPADGIYYLPFTTFGGMIAKDTDEDPFDAPEELERYEALLSADSLTAPYADGMGRVVANLLTTNDITGGNSGSPLLNGNGEVVGIAFDSNYEGVIGDYYYDPDINRTINVDIRYVLFLMQEYSKAGRILEELNIIRN